MTTDTEARELVSRLQVHAYRIIRETATAHSKGGFMTTDEDRAECEMILDKAADTIRALLAENERLRVALSELADCVDDGCYCSEMKMATAVDEARAALKEADK